MCNLQKYLKVNISQNFMNTQETAETEEKTTVDPLRMKHLSNGGYIL